MDARQTVRELEKAALIISKVSAANWRAKWFGHMMDAILSLITGAIKSVKFVAKLQKELADPPEDYSI